MTLSLDYDSSTNQLVLTGAVLDRDIANTINGIHAAGANRWTLPARAPTWIDAEMTVTTDGGVITETAQAWWAAAQTAIAGLLSLKDETTAEPWALGRYTLKPTQAADAKFLAAVRSGLVLNDERTGKTLTIFAALDLLDAFPFYFATLPTVTLEIAEQAQAAFPERKVVVLSSGMTATQRKKLIESGADIVIAGHNVTELHSRLLTYGGLTVVQREKEREKSKYEKKELNLVGFKGVVIDEGHRAQNPKAAATRALWALGDAAQHRFLATATLAANDDSQMWAPLRFCFPDLFPARRKFLDRWVNMVKNPFGHWVCHVVDVVGNDGEKRRSGIKPEVRKQWNLLFSLISVRRARTSGPAVEYRVVPIELPKSQLKAYQQMAEHSMAELDGELLTATDTLTLQHRLMLLAAGTPVIKDGEIASLTMPSAKIDALFELLSESDDKAIVACATRPLADLVRDQLAEQKIPAVAILGGMSQEEHAAAKRAINEGDAKVIVVNQAGAYGKEFPGARRTIVLERSFDYTFSRQVEKRNQSEAQEADTVEVIDVFAKGTLDEPVRRAFLSKDENMHERMRDKDWIRRAMYG